MFSRFGGAALTIIGAIAGAALFAGAIAVGVKQDRERCHYDKALCEQLEESKKIEEESRREAAARGSCLYSDEACMKAKERAESDAENGIRCRFDDPFCRAHRLECPFGDQACIDNKSLAWHGNSQAAPAASPDDKSRPAPPSSSVKAAPPSDF